MSFHQLQAKPMPNETSAIYTLDITQHLNLWCLDTHKMHLYHDEDVESKHDMIEIHIGKKVGKVLMKKKRDSSELKPQRITISASPFHLHRIRYTFFLPFYSSPSVSNSCKLSVSKHRYTFFLRADKKCISPNSRVQCKDYSIITRAHFNLYWCHLSLCK